MFVWSLSYPVPTPSHFQILRKYILELLMEEKQTFLVFVFPGLIKSFEKTFEPPGVCTGPHHVPAAHYNRSQISFPTFCHSLVLSRQFGSTGGLEEPKGPWERKELFRNI